jgi:hypothetical protein
VNAYEGAIEVEELLRTDRVKQIVGHVFSGRIKLKSFDSVAIR